MDSNKFKVVILTNDIADDHLKWVTSLIKHPELFHYRIVDIFSNDWIELLLQEKIDLVLAKPANLKSLMKQVYDERLSIINDTLGINIYPTLTEIKIYENKRFLSDWLKTVNLPHPKTDVFFSQNQALDFSKNTVFPIVAKTNIGASGSGVRILHSVEEANGYIKRCFSSKGAPKSVGPKLAPGTFPQKLYKALTDFDLVKKKFALYKGGYAEKQTGFVIFQKFVEHSFEWRVVCIGESYFAHKKVKKGEKSSGSLIKEYGDVPVQLLDFCESIMTRFSFYSQAIDIFESDGEYLINEMQCIFGQSDPYQMVIDDKPGRYIRQNGEWQFEEGMFNGNESFDTRIDHIIKLLTKPYC